MNTQTWIKRSEREPQQQDCPVMFGHYNRTGEWTTYIYHAGILPELGTHWISINFNPPPRELTQQEMDERNARLISINCPHCDRAGVALQAFYAERRAMCNILTDFFNDPAWGESARYSKKFVDLRTRLDEQGGGK